MTDEARLIPALQLHEHTRIAQALEKLQELGISACSIPVATLPAERVPGWAAPAAGGWFIMIEQARFDEAAAALGQPRGQTPE